MASGPSGRDWAHVARPASTLPGACGWVFLILLKKVNGLEAFYFYVVLGSCPSRSPSSEANGIRLERRIITMTENPNTPSPGQSSRHIQLPGSQ